MSEERTNCIEPSGSVAVGDRVMVIGGFSQIRGCLGIVEGTHCIYRDYYKVSIDGTHSYHWCFGKDLLKQNPAGLTRRLADVVSSGVVRNQ